MNYEDTLNDILPLKIIISENKNSKVLVYMYHNIVMYPINMCNYYTSTKNIIKKQKYKKFGRILKVILSKKSFFYLYVYQNHHYLHLIYTQ